MSKQSKLFDECFALPNSGLKAYFGRVREGNDDHYTTPWYGQRSLKSILQEWLTHLEDIKSKWPGLYEYEIDMASKVGPMSIQKPLSQRMDDIESYYAGLSPSAESIHVDALNAVLHEWTKVRGMHIRGQASVLDQMKLSTNSGSPYFTKRRKVAKETLNSRIKREGNLTFTEFSDGSRFTNAAVLGWRGQEGGPSAGDVKQRVVWMFPFSVNLQELRVYQPLIEGAQVNDLVPAWISMESVDQRITELFSTKADGDLVICTDFSKFDQHFGLRCQEAGRYLFERLLNSDSLSQDWLDTIYPIKYNIPLAFDYGKIRTGQHGMGSGSGGTNADETLVHRALQFEAALAKDTILNPNSMCLGDDGLLSYPGISVEGVIDSYTKHGLEMNPDKQDASPEECIFLRRWHHRDYIQNGVNVGVYSTSRALGRMRELERYMDPKVWSPEAVAIRQLSILENVKYHPLKEEFVQFCMKGDKFRLGIDLPNFFTNLEKNVEEINDNMPDFLGYTRSQQVDSNDKSMGINSWWIVNYLKSLQ